MINYLHLRYKNETGKRVSAMKARTSEDGEIQNYIFNKDPYTIIDTGYVEWLERKVLEIISMDSGKK